MFLRQQKAILVTFLMYDPKLSSESKIIPRFYTWYFIFIASEFTCASRFSLFALVPTLTILGYPATIGC
jgi:hypothetical protein